jgi:hypothetical protein
MVQHHVKVLLHKLHQSPIWCPNKAPLVFTSSEPCRIRLQDCCLCWNALAAGRTFVYSIHCADAFFELLQRLSAQVEPFQL